MTLDRASIRMKSVPKVEHISIPEWEGQTVCVRQLNSAERDRFEGESLDLKGQDFWINLRARLLVLTICDQEGNRLYEDEDLEEVSELPGTVADLLWNRSMSLNKMFKEDLEKTEKN